MRIDTGDLNRLAADLRDAGPEAQERAKTVVAKTALDVVATAQQIVPVDTSATKNSIGADILDRGLAAEIGPTTHYAAYLEYGTSRMAPHAFMGPALDRHTPAFLQALAQAGDPLE